MPGDGGPGEKGKQTGMWSEGKEIGLLEVFRRFISGWLQTGVDRRRIKGV